jgi:hypothetical protein
LVNRRFVAGRFVAGRFVAGRFVAGRFVAGRFLTERIAGQCRRLRRHSQTAQTGGFARGPEQPIFAI